MSILLQDTPRCFRVYQNQNRKLDDEAIEAKEQERSITDQWNNRNDVIMVSTPLPMDQPTTDRALSFVCTLSGKISVG